MDGQTAQQRAIKDSTDSVWDMSRLNCTEMVFLPILQLVQLKVVNKSARLSKGFVWKVQSDKLYYSYRPLKCKTTYHIEISASCDLHVLNKKLRIFIIFVFSDCPCFDQNSLPFSYHQHYVYFYLCHDKLTELLILEDIFYGGGRKANRFL